MKNFEQYLIENFKWFHRHPEMPYEEVQTTAKIRELLTEAGIEILPYPLETGLVAVVRGTRHPDKDANIHTNGQGGLSADLNSIENTDEEAYEKANTGRNTGSGDRTRAALRCDIDALPVTEQTDLDYRSEIPGHMHACGHDYHITAGIGAAILLQEHRDEFSGTVKFLFQPAEEESHGAVKVLESGALDDVPCIWGFHADPSNAVNVVSVGEGYVTAAVDRFEIRVTGVGCHGVHPDDGVDPILAASAIVQGLQSIVSRNVNAMHPSLLSVTRISGGTTWNVIPSETELEGTVRTLNREDRALYERRVREIAERTAAAYGASAEVVWTPGPPATYNDGAMAKICADTALCLGMEVVPPESSMSGDDFAFYLEAPPHLRSAAGCTEDINTAGKGIPGCYIRIGTGVGHPIHHPGFCVDTSAILPTARLLAQLLIS
ncbi:MAG: amidohydrolase [Lachnospiraceae bacterium]|nr:amidohydrolase [Lachnospiraceae bacterium]